MKKKLTFLGIETSCDETAAAIVKENNNSDKVKFLSIWFIISYLGLNNEFDVLNLA